MNLFLRIAAPLYQQKGVEVLRKCGAYQGQQEKKKGRSFYHMQLMFAK
jgi:hypothetical protein